MPCCLETVRYNIKRARPVEQTWEAISPEDVLRDDFWLEEKINVRAGAIVTGLIQTVILGVPFPVSVAVSEQMNTIEFLNLDSFREIFDLGFNLSHSLRRNVADRTWNRVTDALHRATGAFYRATSTLSSNLGSVADHTPFLNRRGIKITGKVRGVKRHVHLVTLSLGSKSMRRNTNRHYTSALPR